MKDRVPVNPGRVLIKPENGSSAYYATMTRADNPTQEGTPLNKNSLLKDSTAALFGLGVDAVPDDVLNAIKTLIDAANANANTKAKIATGSYTGTDKFGENNPNSLTFDFAPKIVWVYAYRFSSTVYPTNDSSAHYNVMSASMLSTSYLEGAGFGQASGRAPYGKKSSDGKTFTWYGSSAQNQYNKANHTYHYIAIG